jgi:transcriptional regulator with XRE-family HTH domain
MKKPTNHKELMDFIDQIPSINEFMESFTVQMRHFIFDRRMQLGWSQTELAQRVTKGTGQPITQTTISRIEGGSPGITSDTYDRVLQTLGMKSIKVEFGETPNDRISTSSMLISQQ